MFSLIWSLSPTEEAKERANPEAFAAAVRLGGRTFLSELATSVLRRPEYGSAWDIYPEVLSSPAARPQWIGFDAPAPETWRAHTAPVDLSDGDEAEVELSAGEAAAFELRPDAGRASIMTVAVRGEAGAGYQWLTDGTPAGRSWLAPDESEYEFCLGRRCADCAPGTARAPGEELLLAVQAGGVPEPGGYGRRRFRFRPDVTITAALEPVEDCSEPDRRAGRRASGGSSGQPTQDLCQNDWHYMNGLCEAIQGIPEGSG